MPKQGSMTRIDRDKARLKEIILHDRSGLSFNTQELIKSELIACLEKFFTVESFEFSPEFFGGKLNLNVNVACKLKK